jgi:hypothetical protein
MSSRASTAAMSRSLFMRKPSSETRCAYDSAVATIAGCVRRKKRRFSSACWARQCPLVSDSTFSFR